MPSSPPSAFYCIQFVCNIVAYPFLYMTTCGTSIYVFCTYDVCHLAASYLRGPRSHWVTLKWLFVCRSPRKTGNKDWLIDWLHGIEWCFDIVTRFDRADSPSLIAASVSFLFYLKWTRQLSALSMDSWTCRNRRQCPSGLAGGGGTSVTSKCWRGLWLQTVWLLPSALPPRQP